MIGRFLRGQKCPPTINGRWYRVFIESNGTDIVLTKADTLPKGSIEIAGTACWFGSETNPYVIADYNVEVHPSGSATDDYMPSLQISSTGIEGISLPSANVFDWMYLYVYAVKE